jgi:hypothetical protein
MDPTRYRTSGVERYHSLQESLNVQSLENALYGLNTTLKAMKLEEKY